MMSLYQWFLTFVLSCPPLVVISSHQTSPYISQIDKTPSPDDKQKLKKWVFFNVNWKIYKKGVIIMGKAYR